MARFHELERATCEVLQNVRQIHELRNAKLSVIGGLAVWHYLPQYRPTDNINFITNLSTSPSSLKKRLLEKPNSPFFQRSQALFYLSPKGQEIQVNISPQWLGPYLPEAATKVEDLSYDEIPYISLTDLIVFKLDSSGLRSNPIKKDRDARDAAALVDHASRRGTIELNEKQEQVVEEALCDVGKCGTREKSWWEAQMGLNREDDDPDATPTAAAEGKQKQKQAGRPHSKSDPTPSQSKPLSNDPNTAWHYEELDHPHVHPHQPNTLRTSGSRKGGLRHSSSHSLLRDIGFIMTHPKTTLTNLVKPTVSSPLALSMTSSSSSVSSRSGPKAKRPGSKQQHYEAEVAADPTYTDEDEDELQYYTLETQGGAGSAAAAAADPQGYFDLPSPRGSNTATTPAVVHRPVGVRRASKIDNFDISPPATPSQVTALRRPPLMEHRSVSFVL